MVINAKKKIHYKNDILKFHHNNNHSGNKIIFNIIDSRNNNKEKSKIMNPIN